MNIFFKKKKKGSLTVEATLVLPIVIITLLFIANILNICMVHVGMQQALNNTAKVVSQNSYILYRFAKEENYATFIEKLGEINEGYSAVESELKITKSGFSELEDSAANTVGSFAALGEPFTKKEETTNLIDKAKKAIEKIQQFIQNLKRLGNNVNDTFNKFNNFTGELKKLGEVTAENGASVVKKLIADTVVGGTGGTVSYILFDNYRKNFGIPMSRISEFNILHSSFNSDGSVTLAVDYLYDNPFSFVNQKSLEYSVINRNIRMTNVVTIKPFIGKNGTSLKNKISKEKNTNEDSKVEAVVVYVYTKSGKKYHSEPRCSEQGNYSVEKLLDDAINEGYTPCLKCVSNNP